MALTRRDYDIIGIIIVLVIILYFFISLLFWIGFITLVAGIIWLIINAKTEHPSDRWWISLILILVGLTIMYIVR